jgi:hypothetical protein
LNRAIYNPLPLEILDITRQNGNADFRYHQAQDRYQPSGFDMVYDLWLESRLLTIVNKLLVKGKLFDRG